MGISKSRDGDMRDGGAELQTKKHVRRFGTTLRRFHNPNAA